MANVARQQTYQFSQNRSPSWTLLVQLSGAHDHLLQEIENFGQVARGSFPDSSQFAAARWKLSQASLRRRSLSARIIEFLSARLEGEDLANLAAFQAADQKMMQRSARHVGRWSIQTISKDWYVYCAASRDIRMLMKAHVQLEQQMLYPMLEQLSLRGI